MCVCVCARAHAHGRVGVCVCVYVCMCMCVYLYTVWVIKNSCFVFIKKSLFSHAMETERLEYGTVRSTVN